MVAVTSGSASGTVPGDGGSDIAETTTDGGERAQAYQEVELLAAHDLSRMWFSRSYLSTITDRRVHGMDRYATRDMFYATTWLDR